MGEIDSVPSVHVAELSWTVVDVTSCNERRRHADVLLLEPAAQ